MQQSEHKQVYIFFILQINAVLPNFVHQRILTKNCISFSKNI